MREGFWLRDVVNYDGTSSTTVVTASYTAESLLTCCVPDLNLDSFPTNVDPLTAELNPKCLRGVLLELPLNKVVQETRLASARVSYDDELEEEVVLLRFYHYFEACRRPKRLADEMGQRFIMQEGKAQMHRSSSVKPSASPVRYQHTRGLTNASLASITPIPRRPGQTPTLTSQSLLLSKSTTSLLKGDTQPAVTALAWAVCDGKTAEILKGCNEDIRCEIASLTKIMTCYLSIRLVQTSQDLTFDAKLRVSRIAANQPGTRAGFREGDQVTLWDLLHGLMLPSGNDAAWCLAEHLGKYIQGVVAGHTACRDYVGFFIMEMNVMAEDMGLSRTVFDNPHGLPNAKNRSCVRDIGKLVSICMRNATFRQVVRTATHTCKLQSHDLHWLNTNKLLNYGWMGVKTGITKNAGPCLTACFISEEQTIIVTLLNCANLEARWRDAAALLNWALSKAQAAENKS